MDKLVEYLHRSNCDHNVILLAKRERIDFLNELAPSFNVVETKFKEFSFGEQVGLYRQIKFLKPDLVHFTMVQQPVLYGGRTVTTMQDLTTIRFRNPTKNFVVFWVKQQIYKWMNKRIARKSSAIITISEFVKQDVARYCSVPLDKITTTLLSADPLADRPEIYGPLDNKQFIMYVGRPLPHKNLSRLIDAFAMLQKSHPELILALAGKKYAMYDIHENRIKKLGIKNILFTDFVSDAQLRWMYENCAAYIFPSLSEGFGLPALEAMLHGAPVVSSTATSLPEVCGDAAEYFDPYSPEDIAAKIDKVISDEKLRKDLIERGHKQARKFSWERMARQTLEVYEKALKT